jgi:hypothetical protein
MRVVRTRAKVKAGDSVTPGQFETRRPVEPVPEGALRSDGG